MSSSAGNSERIIRFVAYKNSLSDPKDAGIMMECFGDHCEYFHKGIMQRTITLIVFFIVGLKTHENRIGNIFHSNTK